MAHVNYSNLVYFYMMFLMFLLRCAWNAILVCTGNYVHAEWLTLLPIKSHRLMVSRRGVTSCFAAAAIHSEMLDSRQARLGKTSSLPCSNTARAAHM
jgi:hypothetical protein